MDIKQKEKGLNLAWKSPQCQIDKLIITQNYLSVKKMRLYYGY